MVDHSTVLGTMFTMLQMTQWWVMDALTRFLKEGISFHTAYLTGINLNIKEEQSAGTIEINTVIM